MFQIKSIKTNHKTNLSKVYQHFDQKLMEKSYNTTIIIRIALQGWLHAMFLHYLLICAFFCRDHIPCPAFLCRREI